MATNLLQAMLDPLVDCFTPSMAEQLVNLRADKALQARIDELADKNSAGILTPKEREEYELYVNAADIIAILQSKARRFLARSLSK